jgi:type II secretory pathway component GspD/PulD (secretin)
VDQGYYIPQVNTMRQGVVFDVRPVISFDKKYVTVRLRPSMSERSQNSIQRTRTVVSAIAGGGEESGTTLVATATLPYTQVFMKYTRLYTHATVPDGGSVVIGGQLRDTRNETMSGIPVISELPLIGRLTRTEVRNREKRNLLLVVGTKIIELEE